MRRETGGLNLRSAKRERAFTFVEVMVACVILSFLLGSLYMLFTRSFSGVEAGKSKLINLQDAALTLEYIKQDIKGGYFGKSSIRGSEIDGEKLFSGGDGQMEFSKLYYDPAGEEVLKKVSYKLDRVSGTLNRTEEGGGARAFAKGRIKTFSANLHKGSNHTFIDVIIKVETDEKQTVELRNAIFPRDVQAVNKNWVPNMF